MTELVLLVEVELLAKVVEELDPGEDVVLVVELVLGLLNMTNALSKDDTVVDVELDEGWLVASVVVLDMLWSRGHSVMLQ